MAKPFDVVGLGENSVDLLAVVERFPAPGDKRSLVGGERLVGGQIATAMVGCARLGWRACYAGVVGDDDAGRLVEGTLSREGVATRLLRRPRAATRGAIIVVERASGRRTVLEHRDPAVAMTGAEVSQDVVTSGRLLLVDARDPVISLAAARLARRAGVPVVLDVEHATRGVDQLLREVDVIVAAEGFPAEMTGIGAPGRALARLATEFRPSLAVVTLGPRGSLARSGGREVRTAAFKVKVVDTTGAGDAFRAGLIAGWLGSNGDPDVSQVLQYANAVAALNCRQLGAQAGLPTAAEVAVFVTGNRRGQSK